MLADLKDIIEKRVRCPMDLGALRDRFGDQPLDSPARSVEFATAYCRAALPCILEEPDISVAGQGADLLIRFVAQLPDDLCNSIDRLARFVPPAERAWREPVMDDYVGLCCAVHDIWAHLVGPESEEDRDIVRNLLASPARHAIDFGAGAGHFAHELAAHGVEVDVVEIDSVKRAFLAFRAEQSGLGHMMRIGARRVVYDLGIAINVLDHMEDPAEVVRYFAVRLPPGARLWTLAAFPTDGWHQSDDSAIDRCAEALWEHFLPECRNAPHVPWLESFTRRASKEPNADPRIPKLHAAAQWKLSADDGTILNVDSRFCRPCVLNSDAAEICRELDGRECLESVAQRTGVDVDDLLNLCDHLRGLRLITWFSPAS
jgi:hypothetical protein